MPARRRVRCRRAVSSCRGTPHHARPTSPYCITTGWCNAPLDAIGFFRRLESAITRVTGVTPRHDDRRYEARYDRPGGEMASGRG